MRFENVRRSSRGINRGSRETIKVPKSLNSIPVAKGEPEPEGQGQCHRLGYSRTHDHLHVALPDDKTETSYSAENVTTTAIQ